MAPRQATVLVSLVLPAAAYAHGEDVLIPIYAQAAVVVATMLGLWLMPKVRAHRVIASLGCLAGATSAWLSTSHLPFQQNRSLITLVMAVAPVASAALFIFVAKRYASKHAET